MKKRKKHKNFFRNKYCSICKKPATKFRLMNSGRRYMLCDSSKCDYFTRLKEGHFDKTVFDSINK